MPFAADSIHCAFPDLNRKQPEEENQAQKKEEESATEGDVKENSSSEVKNSEHKSGIQTGERIDGSEDADPPG